MSKRMLFIYNPNAGKGRIKSKLSGVLELFSKAGYELIVYPTKQKNDAKEIVAKYAAEQSIDLVACSGGDGMLNEVISGMMKIKQRYQEEFPMVPVGYIPSGTTNDFGYSLCIPKDMMAAAKLVVDGNALVCDVGSLNDRFFAYTAAFGLFSDVSYDTPQTFKNQLGRLAYILSGATRLHDIKTYHLKVETEDEIQEDDFIVGMVSNSNSVGGFRGITGKKVRLDDGIFELILIRRPKNIVEISTIVNDLLRSDLSGKYIYYKKISRVKLTSDTELSWSLDGEFGGMTNIANIVIHKQQIPYLCNRNK